MDRGNRRSRTGLVAERRRRLLLRLLGPDATASLAHRMRNGNPIGCGTPRCRLCHRDKVDGIPHCRDVRLTLPDEPGAKGAA
jgi:hypothetical protein